MIEIDGLSKNYGSFRAVKDISFTIAKGEILGLLGPNGAGKSTTMRMLTGFLHPSSGTVRVSDLDIRQDAIKIKRQIGYLPESAPLYPDMLVYEYLQYIADIRQIPSARKPERISELAALCGLQEVMHRSINQLSKGYKQRVGLAHAMMSDPEILVLDEPTSGLDPNQIIEIRDIIKQIGKQKTVILSTHILSEAEATCDRIIIIHRGQIVADDRTEALKQEADSKSTITLALSGCDEVEARSCLEAVSGVQHIHVRSERENGHLMLDIRCGDAPDMRRSIYQAIKAQPWDLLEFSRRTRTLETIFRELTQGA